MFISVLTQHRIKQVSFSIYRSIQISPAAINLDVSLVQVPRSTGFTSTFRTKIFADQWCEPILPYSYRFVANFETTLQKQLCHIAEAEFVPQTPEDSQQDDIGRKLKIVEWCTRSFIETPIAVAAEECSITQ
jgi:hypothetical protein